NLAGPAEHAEMIGRTERLILKLDANLPHFTKMSWWQFITLVCGLAAVACASPLWRPVSRFVALKKWVERAVAGVAVAASFSFFSDHAVLLPQVQRVNARLEARYRDSQERERR